jgi:hypothetical protein
MAAKPNPYAGDLFNPEKGLSGKALSDAAKKFAEAKYRTAIDQSRRDTQQVTADRGEGLRRLQGYYDSFKPEQAAGVDTQGYQFAKAALADKSAAPSSEGGSYSDKMRGLLSGFADRGLVNRQQDFQQRVLAQGQRAKEDYGQKDNRYLNRIDQSKRNTSDLLSQYGGEYNTRLMNLRQGEAANAAARKKAEYDYQLGQQRLQMEQQRYNNDAAIRQAAVQETIRHNRQGENKGSSLSQSERTTVGNLVGKYLPQLQGHTRAYAIKMLKQGLGFQTPQFQNGRQLMVNGKPVMQGVSAPAYLVDEAVRQYEAGGGKFKPNPKSKRR